MNVAIVVSELLGRAGTGGAGTADSLLAIALARHGHDVRLLVASGRDIGALNPEWSERYETAGVDLHLLERAGEVTPSFIRPSVEVLQALRADPPEVAIVNDWRGLGYAPLRARQTGQALTETAFVVHCHSPGRVLTEFARKVPDVVDRFGEQVMEQTSMELADAVVSPTEWLLDWLRTHSWPVPDSATVIPYVRQSAAFDSEPGPGAHGGRVRRLAFFGQLREGKGIRLFVQALAAVDSQLLDGLEIVFLGSGRGRWASDNLRASLSPAVTERVAEVRIETGLEREAALRELCVDGTLAVMPSLLDNAPNTVSECIENGVPFISTETGGIPELIAEEDRARVLCAPTSRDLAVALTHALTSPDGIAPARAAHDPREAVERWLEIVGSVKPAIGRPARAASHIAVIAQGEESARRAQRLAAATANAEVEVVVAESRRAGFERTSADWIVFLDEDDDPDDTLLDAFAAAQALSEADVVTAAVRTEDGIHCFLGEPGALGLLENHYGVLGFLRSDAVAAQLMPEDAVDPEWPLLARIALAGGQIVSLPDALSTHGGKRGSVADVPGEGLAVLDAFEARGATGGLQDLPQLATTLGAALAKQRSGPRSPDGQTGPVLPRLRRRVFEAVRARHR